MKTAKIGVVLFLALFLFGCGGQAQPVVSPTAAGADAAEPEAAEAPTEPGEPEAAGEKPVADEPAREAGAKPADEAALPVLYDFWAVWCPPCREQKPIIEELQREFAGRVDVRPVNVDEQGELAKHFDVKVIPTLVFVDAAGKEVERLTGVTQKDKLVERFRAHGFIE